jgi:uncharacterized protein YgiM (DUF1202 family)
MARRFFLFSITLLALASLALAEQTPPEIANSRNRAVGTINTDGVYVRSGAGDNYYPTTKLNKDVEVTVVGEKFDWLKIVPPKGSFCYVAKAFVDKTGENAGAANRDDVNVRAGSELNAAKTTVQSKLASGQPVEILGEVDEYYKIAPPADAYVYVKKDYVELKKVIPQVAKTDATTPALADASATLRTPPLLSGQQIAATTNPAESEIAAATPTTMPSGASAQTSYEKLEAEFDAASKKPIEEQPIAELTKGYQTLLADAQLPESLKRIADFRLQTLKVRGETRDQFLATQKQIQETRQKQLAMKAEQEEIAQQIKQKDVKVYTAVGTLRTSSIQQGGQVMYRLTDPQTGRTVCYLRSDDPKYGAMLGQFIGVRGQLASETGLNLKVLAATDFAKVDPNELYRGVAAQIVPPSLLPNAAQIAKTTTE